MICQFCDYLLRMTVSDDGQARYVFMINILENKMFSRNKVLPDKKSILRTKVQSIFSLKSNYNHDAVGQKSLSHYDQDWKEIKDNVIRLTEIKVYQYLGGFISYYTVNKGRARETGKTHDSKIWFNNRTWTHNMSLMMLWGKV